MYISNTNFHILKNLYGPIGNHLWICSHVMLASCKYENLPYWQGGLKTVRRHEVIEQKYDTKFGFPTA